MALASPALKKSTWMNDDSFPCPTATETDLLGLVHRRDCAGDRLTAGMGFGRCWPCKVALIAAPELSTSKRVTSSDRKAFKVISQIKVVSQIRNNGPQAWPEEKP